MSLPRRVVLLSLAALAACGDGEPEQRKAFIAFLQTRILDKPGIHVPHPTADEAKSWGPYADQYLIITAFNDGISQRVTAPMNQALARGAVTSLEELAARRADLVEARRGLATIRSELDKQFAAAEAAHAGLKQPADLKPVYDAAYERDVSGPARAFGSVLPEADDAIGAAVEVADFMAQHRGAVVLQGGQVQVADPALLRQLNDRLAAMNAKAQVMQAAQQRLQTMVNG